MALNIPPQNIYFYKSNWAPNIDQSLLDSIIRLKHENDFQGTMIPKPFFSNIIATSVTSTTSTSNCNWMLCTNDGSSSRRDICLLQGEGGWHQWIMEDNVVISSDETWDSIFKKHKLAGAYYYEGEPEFNRLSVMFCPKEIKQEKLDDVIVISDNTIHATSTEVITPTGIANEAKVPKSRRKLFDEATQAGDCESNNTKILHHHYIMGPSGELA